MTFTDKIPQSRATYGLGLVGLFFILVSIRWLTSDNSTFLIYFAVGCVILVNAYFIEKLDYILKKLLNIDQRIDSMIYPEEKK